MQQAADLEGSAEFDSLGIALVSVTHDTLPQLSSAAAQFGVHTALLSDAEHGVTEAYGVLQWAMASGEPGHTFVLVDAAGTVRWIRDYGAAQNGGLMYVQVPRLLQDMKGNL